MTTTILQLDIEWGRPEVNICRAEKLIESCPQSDLYVLPEMWSTGFATEPGSMAEHETDSLSLEWMIQTAQKLSCAIVGSIAILADEQQYFNRQYFVNGKSGKVEYYDKHHLFRYGGEDRFYTPGSKHTIVNYCGFRILLITCYDLRFPNWSRYADQRQFDAIICVANWPQSRQNAWQILTRARAIENQAFFIGCNRVGHDQLSHYLGNSCIISPIGKTLAYCGTGKNDTATFDLNIEQLRHLRNKFRVLDDRDIF